MENLSATCNCLCHFIDGVGFTEIVSLLTVHEMCKSLLMHRVYIYTGLEKTITQV